MAALIDKQDCLGAYAAKERAPIRGSFLGYDIISLPPPRLGRGRRSVEALNVLGRAGIPEAGAPFCGRASPRHRKSGGAWYLDSRRAFSGDTDLRRRRRSQDC
jgi:gamma-glutamyltranspeptidase